MRYLPLSEADRQAMLATIGVDGIDDLYRDVPAPVHLDRAPDLPPHADEMTVERAVAAMAARNLDPATAPCFLGAGAYRHHIPATVDDLIRRGEFLTAYTPYQPEISQGTLQTLFEFQTQVALITGMDVANASMYDGATACVEAIMMAERATRRRRAVISGGLHPHYRAVADTYARFNDFTLAGPDPDPNADDAALADLIDDGTACVVVQTPDLFGRPRNLTALAEAAHAKGALLVAVVTEVVSLGLLESPGAMGADIVAAEGQSLGNPTGFGGPHVGLLACRDKLVRQMPGRLAGQTVDADGRRGWVLTLVAREQHIRREKATSNICTNSGLCALAFSIHLGLLGEAGLTRLAELNHGRAVQAAERLARVPGVQVLNDAFFNEFTVRVPGSATKVVEALATRGLLAGVPVARLVPGRFDDLMLVAVTETVTEADIDLLARALEELP